MDSTDVTGYFNAQNDEEDGPELGPLSTASIETGTPTAGALTSAQDILARSGQEKEVIQGEYKGILAQRQEQANAARETLRRAREALMQRKYSTRAQMFDVAAGLTAPTRSGTSSEGWSNAFNAMATGAREKDRYDAIKDQGMLNVDYDLAGMGNGPNATSPDLVKDQLAQLMLRQRLNTSEANRALQVLGHGVPGSGSGGLPIEKMMRAQGIQEGSAEWNAGLRAARAKMLHMPNDPNAPVTLTDPDKRNAERYGHYFMSAQDIRGRTAPEKWQAMLDYAYESNPNFDPTKWAPFQQALKQYGSEKNTDPGGQIRAFGTAVEHLAKLKELARGLKTSDMKTVTSLKNYFSKQFNGAAVPDFETAVQLVGPELLNSVSPGATGVEERNNIAKLLSSSNAPDVVASQVDTTLLPMMASKINNHRQGFYSNIPEEALPRYKGWFEQKIPSGARTILRQLGTEGDWGDGQEWDAAPTGGPRTTGKAPSIISDPSHLSDAGNYYFGGH